MTRLRATRRSFTVGASASIALAWPAHAEAAKVLIAVYAGQDVQLWDRVVVQPYNKTASVKAEVFEAALPAVSVAQAGGNPPFNAALMNAAQAYDLHSRGLLNELTEDDIPDIRLIPKKLWPTTKSGTILGMPTSFSLYVIAYNTDLAKASDFESWTALVDRKWKDQVSLTRPAILARFDLVLFSKIFGGDDNNVEPGYEFIAKLAANALNVYSSMASLMSQLGRGEVVAAPFYVDEIVLMRTQGVKNIGFVVPKEGALIIPYLVAIPKGAKDVSAAKTFVNALADPVYQQPFLTESGSLPTNPAVQMPADLAKALGGSEEQIMAHNIAPDWAIVAAQLEARTRKVEEIINKSK